ncbi:hypothetical protein AAFN86_05505 [Roseomonas sp. CAU 1739]
MIRAVILLAVLAALGAGVAWLDRRPPPPGASAPARLAGERPPAPVGAPSGDQAALATPFGDALFRWRCTTGLRDALGERTDWPLERIASLCLCAANRLREDGPRDIVIGTGEVALALETAEARLCRRR